MSQDYSGSYLLSSKVGNRIFGFEMLTDLKGRGWFCGHFHGKQDTFSILIDLFVLPTSHFLENPVTPSVYVLSCIIPMCLEMNEALGGGGETRQNWGQHIENS